jgi:hypothetical protein
MPDFIPHALELAEAHAEVAEFRALLQSNPDLREAVLLGFFRARPHLTALIGHYNPDAGRGDLLAFEYPRFGEFRCRGPEVMTDPGSWGTRYDEPPSLSPC